MTATIWRHDLIAWSIQVALLVATGTLLARLLRLSHPRASLAWWRLLLAACLLLPVCQPWMLTPASPRPVAPLADAGTIITVAGLTQVAAPAAAWSMPGIDALVLWLLAIGVVVRAIWLIVGAWTLHHLRRTASPLDPLPPVWTEAQARIGVRARVLVAAGVHSPITFGVIAPVVIVPPCLSSMPEAVQHAIAVHELLHVRRRDWIDTIAEEIVRAACWFHPGVWWLIGRIRVSREQVVDRAAIELTDSRESYVDALLAVARSRLPRILVPAAPFLRRTALKERVACILQETSMTTRRLIATMTASAAVLALTGTMAVRAFPLQADEPSTTGTAAPTALTAPTAQGSQDAGQDAPAPVQIVRGGEHLLHGMTPEYPKQAIEKRIEGEVVLDLSLDERGEVSDARVVSGPEELRRVALASVLQWHYSPAALRSTSVQVALQFHVPPPNAELERRGYALKRVSLDVDAPTTTRIEELEHMLAEAYAMMQRPDLTNEQRDELKAKALEAQKRLEKMRAGQSLARVREESGNPPSIDGRLVRVITERVPREAVQELMTQVGLSVGDPITRDTIQRIVKVAESLDEHIRVNVRKTEGGVILVLVAP